MMKLTKAQRKNLHNLDWNVLEYSKDSKESNCATIIFTQEDGLVYKEICELFDLFGDKPIQLLIVATKEGYDQEEY